MSVESDRTRDLKRGSIEPCLLLKDQNIPAEGYLSNKDNTFSLSSRA